MRAPTGCEWSSKRDRDKLTLVDYKSILKEKNNGHQRYVYIKNDETVTCTPDKLVPHSKKRDASSPLQDPSLELKKSKINTSPLSRAEEPEGSDMTSKSGETVLTEQDLNNIAAKMQDIFLPAVQKMIDSSVQKIKKVYDDKLEAHNQRIDDLSDENDELRSEISSLRLEVDRLKSRDDELEQYSRRNSIRIAGMKDMSDKRPI